VGIALDDCVALRGALPVRFAVMLGSVVAFAAAITVGVALSAEGPVGADRPTSQPTSARPDGDWQWMSSGGAEVQVPASWVIDDGTCSPSRMPVLGVVRQACDAKVQRGRPLVEINGPLVKGQAGQPLSIDGQPAHRAKTTLPDGSSRGSVRFDTLPITVTATLTDAALQERILDSVTLQAVDHVGCHTGTPPAGRPAASTAGTERLIPPGATAISACQYARSSLQASARLDRQQAARLVAAVNSAPAGANPDRRCSEKSLYPFTVVATYADRPPVTVHVRSFGCTGRGLDNGTRISSVTRKVVNELADSLKTSTAYGSDLPAR
jgi:hypothetical protein